MSAKKTILVVDDEPDLRETVSMILTESGYHVLTAADSAEAVEAAQVETPDLIISDVMMDTNLAGFRLSVEFSKMEATANVPIIMLSGVYKEIPDLPSPEECGLPVAAFLEKPVKPEELVEHVRKALGE